MLWRLSDGLRTKEVATVLNISTYTVQTHVRNIYGKLGVRSAAEAVAFYFKRDRGDNRPLLDNPWSGILP